MPSKLNFRFCKKSWVLIIKLYILELSSKDDQITLDLKAENEVLAALSTKRYYIFGQCTVDEHNESFVDGGW